MNGLVTIIAGVWLPCLLLLLLLLLDPADSQTLQDGVDLVTKISNNLLPDFFGTLAVGNTNVVLGPFGVATNLVLLLEASNGKARDEILRALNISVDDIAALRVGFSAYCNLFLHHSTHPDPAGAFNSATLRSGFQTQTAFQSIMTKHYCANFLANATEGSSLTFESHSGVMAHWKDYEKLAVYTFLSHQDLRPFMYKEGISAPVPMIPQVGVFKSGTWKNARVVLLPLESNIVDLMLIMPEKSNKINSIAKSLNANTIISLVSSLKGEELEIFIPQLATVSRKLNLTSLVRSRGITLVFDDNHAELNRAFEKERHAYLEQISQNAYFTTSFTTLNAISGISSNIELKSRKKRDANKIYFNKPFLFLVLHKDTKLVLLAGKIEDPTQVPN